MLAPRLRQSMSYSLWFSISAFILDLSSCPPRFRAWTSGAGREAGSWQVDTIEISPTLESAISSYDADSPVQLYRNGRVEDKELISGIPWSSVPGGDMMNRNRYISTQRQSAETRPVNIAVPVILYLGLRA